MFIGLGGSVFQNSLVELRENECETLGCLGVRMCRKYWTLFSKNILKQNTI